MRSLVDPPRCCALQGRSIHGGYACKSDTPHYWTSHCKRCWDGAVECSFRESQTQDAYSSSCAVRHLRGRYEVIMSPRLWTPVTDCSFRLVFITCAVPQDTVQSTTRLPGMLSTLISHRGMAPSLRILRAWKATLGELHRGGACVRLCVALTSSNILRLSTAHGFPFRNTVVLAVTTKTQLSQLLCFQLVPRHRKGWEA